MANSEAIGGIHSYLLYGKETTWGSAVAVTTHLGLVTSFKPSVNSNLKANRGFVGTTSGGRNVVKFTPGVLETSMSADFTVTRWDFMEHVLGQVSGSGPYTYAEIAVPPSMTIASNIDNPGSGATDQEATYAGSVIETCTIRASVGEPVNVSLDMKAKYPVLDTTLSSAVALPDEEVYNFTGGTIALPSGTPLTNIIDSVEVTIKNNYTLHPGMGSRLPVAALPKARDYTLKVSLKYLDNALYTAALGATTPTATGTPTEYATFVLTFAQGNRSLIATFSGVPMSDFAQMHNLNEIIGEDLSFMAKSCTAVEDRSV